MFMAQSGWTQIPGGWKPARYGRQDACRYMPLTATSSRTRNTPSRCPTLHYRSKLAAARADRIFCDGTKPAMNSRRNSANVPAAIAVRTSAISFTYMCEL